PPSEEEIIQCSVWEYTEKFPVWTCIEENVRVTDIQQQMKKHPILCTKLLTKELMLPSQIKHANRKLLSQHKTRPNPRYIGFIDYKSPKGYNGLIYKERFKRCNHPNCLKSGKCTMEFEIRHTTDNDNNCVSFWVKGKHCEDFTPTHKFFTITK